MQICWSQRSLQGKWHSMSFTGAFSRPMLRRTREMHRHKYIHSFRWPSMRGTSLRRFPHFQWGFIIVRLQSGHSFYAWSCHIWQWANQVRAAYYTFFPHTEPFDCSQATIIRRRRAAVSALKKGQAYPHFHSWGLETLPLKRSMHDTQPLLRDPALSNALGRPLCAKIPIAIGPYNRDFLSPYNFSQILSLIWVRKLVRFLSCSCAWREFYSS